MDIAWPLKVDFLAKTISRLNILGDGVCQNSQDKEMSINNSGPKVIKLFSRSTQLSTKFQLLIKTEIPTNKEFSCFKSLQCCIFHDNKC